MRDSVTSFSSMSESIRSRGRVLVVDDEKPNVTLLARLLQSEGYEVCTAGDGESALEAVARERPDVILLDVLMPRLSGFDVCRRLKEVRKGWRREDLVGEFIALAREGQFLESRA